MPQAVLEACVTGLPVVATRVGGLPELIEPGVTGVLVEPNDPAAVTAAFLGVIADPQRGRRMGAAARARVEARFDVRRMAAHYHSDALRLLRAKGCGTARTCQVIR
jgi:glycosyltransferase involved in cell wall biosynthesis